MNRDNVIQLPIRNRMLKIKNNLRLRFDLEQRKVITSASIVSILVAVAFLNDRLMVPESSARGIASIASENPADSAFAKELSSSSQNATFALRATPLDQFTYGILEGKYALRVYQGRVQEAHFMPEDAVHPTLVKNRAEFLKQAQRALGISFVTVSKINERIENAQKYEEFSLLDKQNQTLAKVELRVDDMDRLLALKFMN